VLVTLQGAETVPGVVAIASPNGRSLAGEVLRASPDDTVMAVLVDALDVLPLGGHDPVLIFLRGRSGAWYELWTGRPVDITHDPRPDPTNPGEAT